jgi:3-oxoadipate enol-lactonase
MDAAGIETAHWVGLSIGGMIGLRIASTAPDRIGRLVVASAGVYMAPPELWNGRIKTAQNRGIEPLAQPTMGMWFTNEFIAANPQAVDAVRTQFVQTTLDGFTGCSAAMRDMDQRETIRAVTAPTLVIVGSNDQNTSPNEAALIVGRVPTARGIILKGSHIINVEQAEAFTAAVLDFLG